MSQRIQKIKETYSQQFEKQLQQENVDISLDSAWDILVSADPSPNKKNVRWLVEAYINNGFLWEDIATGPTSKVSETLTEFNKHKRNLEPAERSLTKYLTLGSLWSSIKPYVGQLTANEEKREERDKAYSEAEVVVDRDDGLKIIVPKTEYAAKWFGKGTRWCTSADNNNMFENYALASPLFIIFMPNGEKLQLWKNGNQIQFMDENDDSVTKDYTWDNWEYLKDIVEWTGCISIFPEEILTYDLCMQHIYSDVDNFRHIPDKMKTEQMCRIALSLDPMALQYMPDEYKEPDLCLDAVKRNANAFLYVPKHMRSQEMCNIALEVHPSFLECVPEEMKTDELLRNVLSQYPRMLDVVKNKTMEFCELAVSHDGNALQFVPNEFKTPEMCDQAVKHQPWALRHVPENLITEDMCLNAVRKDGYIIEKSIPKNMITKELCIEAIKENARVVAYIPDEYKTKEMYEFAVQRNGKVLASVPEELRSYKMCFKAVEDNGSMLYDVPNKFKTHALCKAAVANTPGAMSSVPGNILTYDFCQYFVSRNALYLEYIGLRHKDEQMCLLALRQNKHSKRVIKWVPEELVKTSEKIRQYYTEAEKTLQITKPLTEPAEQIYNQYISEVRNRYIQGMECNHNLQI